jgi:hypothetical protein
MPSNRRAADLCNHCANRQIPGTKDLFLDPDLSGPLSLVVKASVLKGHQVCGVLSTHWHCDTGLTNRIALHCIAGSTHASTASNIDTSLTISVLLDPKN